MSATRSLEMRTVGEAVPEELVSLRERIRGLSEEVRAELEPLVDDALEDAKYRVRVVGIADALERLRLEMAMLRFDLEATRRERELLRGTSGR